MDIIMVLTMVTMAIRILHTTHHLMFSVVVNITGTLLNSTLTAKS